MLNKIKCLIRNKVLPDRLFLMRGNERGRALYLTFDDGPDELVTGALLNLLSKYQVKATFFVLGSQAEKFPELVKRIVSEGHSLGNHSYNHPRFDRLSSEERNLQIDKTNKLINQLSSSKCRLFRSPQGRWDLKLLIHLMRKRITAVHWSRDSMDFKKDPVEVLVKRFETAPVQAGDIILFHDDNTLCVDALDVLIPHWQAQGFNLQALESYSL